MVPKQRRIIKHQESTCYSGIVAGNNITFDESSLTGESRPVSKEVGDKVFLGTVNKSSAVRIKVDSVGGMTM